MAINTSDMQPFHIIPEGLPTFERVPPTNKKVDFRAARRREILLARVE